MVTYEFAWKDNEGKPRKVKLGLGEHRIASDEGKERVYLFSQDREIFLPGIDPNYISRYSKGGTVYINCTLNGAEVATGKNSYNEVWAARYFIPYKMNSVERVENFLNPVSGVERRAMLPSEGVILLPREDKATYWFGPREALRLILKPENLFKPEKLIGVLFCLEE
ncbi:MAG: hypothetical protein QXL86_03480 [Candidatus Aenigmatarchaeota archaeon]